MLKKVDSTRARHMLYANDRLQELKLIHHSFIVRLHYRLDVTRMSESCDGFMHTLRLSGVRSVGLNSKANRNSDRNGALKASPNLQRRSKPVCFKWMRRSRKIAHGSGSMTKKFVRIASYHERCYDVDAI